METLTEILGLSVHDMGNDMENDDEYVTSKHRKEIGFTAWVDKQPEWLGGINGPFLMPNMNIAWSAYNAGMKFAEQKTIEQHRAEFEEWAKDYGYQEDELRRSPFSFVSTKYFDAQIEHHWQVWLAARGINE